MFAPARTEATSPGEPRLSPILQRMRKAYPDLESGRFVSLADFESPGQVGLFRTLGVSGDDTGQPEPSLSILRSRNETGAGSLKFRLESPEQRLVCDGQRSTELALVRDWRNYSLLLMSLLGPPQGATIEFCVQSGESAPLRWTRTVRVAAGWTLLRFDVASIGDVVDLSDVRVLSWRAPLAAAPVELYLDDLILADNTRQIITQTTQPDDLYVTSRGQRIVVGAAGRFELAFADGLIVAWRDAAGTNLADIGGLGPWPVPLPADWASTGTAVAYDDPQLFAAWGQSASSSQRLLEATPFRVVIEGQWRFDNEAPADGRAAEAPGSAARASSAGHTWRYVVYPSGRVHVRLTSSAGSAGWSGPRVGFAIGLDGRRTFGRVEPAAASDSAAFMLVSQRGSPQPDLLWTWPAAGALRLHREWVSADDRRLALVAGDVAAATSVDTVHLLRVWPADMDSPVEGESFAGDMANPARMTVTTGELLTDAEGDRDHDGWNEADGAYELAPAGGALRFTIDPGRRLRFDPVFHVQDTADRQCWVYARGRSISALGRDAGGDLLFRLPSVLSSPADIEVHTRPKGTP